MTSLPILKTATIAGRRAACGACEHVVHGPPPWNGRKFFCGLLYNGDPRDRGQDAYLPTRTERPSAACPAGRWRVATPDQLRGPDDPPIGEAEELGPMLWRQLHERAKAYTGNRARELGWLVGFARRVPCGECRRHWRQLVKDHPPALESAEAYHRWTVDRHNDVNRRLGKPEWRGEAGGE